MRPQRVVQTGVEHVLRHVGGHHVARAAGFVFRVVIVPALGKDIGHSQRPVAHHRGGQLTPRREGLDHDGLGHVVRQARRRIARLDQVHVLGAFLVHGQRRGQDARMGIGQLLPFEEPLHTAILAPAAVERIEDDIGGDLGQTRNKVGARIDLDHVESFCPQSGGTFLAGTQRHLPLCGRSTHDDRHFGVCPARHPQNCLCAGLGPFLCRPHLPAAAISFPGLFALCRTRRFADAHDFPM